MSRYHARSSGIYDVRDYGATPSDVGIGLQNALNTVVLAQGGAIYVPPLPGGAYWGWQTNVFKIANTHGIAIEVFGEPGTVIQLNLNNTADDAFGVFNNFYGSFWAHDLVILSTSSATASCESVFDIETFDVIIVERCSFFNIQAGAANSGLILASAGQIVTLRDVKMNGCGNLQTDGACVVAQGLNVTLDSCTFEDVGAFQGMAVSAVLGNAWAYITAADQVNILNSNIDEDQVNGIVITNASTSPLASVRIAGCYFNSANLLGNPAGTGASITIAGSLGVQTLHVEDCFFQECDSSRSQLKLTNVATTVVSRCSHVFDFGQPGVGTGQGGLILRVGSGCGSIRVEDTPSPVYYDTTSATPQSLSEMAAGKLYLLPPSIPGLKAWYRVDNLVKVFATRATVTGVGGTFATVTPTHHLDIQVDGYTYSIAFSGSENSVTAFIATINTFLGGGGLFSVANVSGQIQFTAQVEGDDTTLTGPVCSGAVLGTSSSDVLTSLGLTVGNWTAATVRVLTDMSGLNDSSHILAGMLTNPTYNVVGSIGTTGRPTLSFTGSQGLATPTWSAALPQPYTIVVVAKQTSAAAAVLFDGLTANSNSLTGAAGETTLAANFGSSVTFSAPASSGQVYTFVASGASSNLAASADSAQSNQNAGTNSLAAVTVGQIGAGGTSAGWEIGEVIVFDHVLTLQERQRINAYASAYWGLSLQPIALSAGTGISVSTVGTTTTITNTSPGGSGVTSITANSPITGGGTGSVSIGLTTPLPVTDGGTGNGVATQHGVAIGQNLSPWNFAGPGATTGVPLIAQGLSADPSFGTAVVAGGGTGQTSFSSGSLLIGNGTSPLNTLAAGTLGNVALDNGSTWTSSPLASNVTSAMFTQFTGGFFKGSATLTSTALFQVASLTLTVGAAYMILAKFNFTNPDSIAHTGAWGWSVDTNVTIQFPATFSISSGQGTPFGYYSILDEQSVSAGTHVFYLLASLDITPSTLNPGVAASALILH